MDAILLLLSAATGGRVFVFGAVTAPKVKAGSPFKGRLIKVSRVRARAGQSYAGTVQRAGGEGFEAAPRKWGTRVTGTHIVEHKGKTYVEAIDPESVAPVRYYLFDGHRVRPVSKAVAEAELAPVAESKRQADAGATRQVIVRDYRTDRVIYVAAEGERRIVRRSLADGARAALAE